MAVRSLSFIQSEIGGPPGGGGNPPTIRPGTPDRPPLPTSQQSSPDQQTGKLDEIDLEP